MTDLICTRTIRARKPHRCFACLRMIEKGESHTVDAYTDNGRAYRLRTHHECDAETKEHECDADGFPEGYLCGDYIEDDTMTPAFVAWRNGRRAQP